MTRRSATCLVVTLFVCLFVVAGTGAAQNVPCRTIQDGGITTQNYFVNSSGGLLTDQNGNYEVAEVVPVSTGYDEYGYNYGAHNFSGWYHNYMRPSPIFIADYPPGTPTDHQWADEQLNMTWNDAWLSNRDCNGDGALDRPDSYEHEGIAGYQGTGAALVIHMGGACGYGKNWERQVKVEAVPLGAYVLPDKDAVPTWYIDIGNGKKKARVRIGYQIWGGASPFAVTSDSINNGCPELALDPRFVVPAPNPLLFQTTPATR